VLLAMGLDRATASASVRFSVGKDTTPEEIDRALERLQTIVARMRKKTVAS
jgi:cysteine desulfurase